MNEISILFSFFLRLNSNYFSNTYFTVKILHQKMKNLKKIALAALLLLVVILMDACHRGYGCPTDL
jgi:hypothetical protein